MGSTGCPDEETHLYLTGRIIKADCLEKRAVRHPPEPHLSGRERLAKNAERFRGGLIFKAHGLLYHSTPGMRVIKKKKKLRVDRFRVSDSVFLASELSSRGAGLGNRVSGFRSPVSGLGTCARVSKFRSRDSGADLGFQVSGPGFRISGFELRISGVGFEGTCFSDKGIFQESGLGWKRTVPSAPPESISSPGRKGAKVSGRAVLVEG